MGLGDPDLPEFLCWVSSRRSRHVRVAVPSPPEPACSPWRTGLLGPRLREGPQAVRRRLALKQGLTASSGEGLKRMFTFGEGP